MFLRIRRIRVLIIRVLCSSLPLLLRIIVLRRVLMFLRLLIMCFCVSFVF